jgi:uncharacterized protein (TIGR02265 family)
MPTYAEPAWDAPLDGQTYLRACPTSATIKGMFTGAIVAEARRRGVTLAAATADKYHGFLDYPLVDHLRLVLEASPIFWPDMSLRQSLRKMGRAAVNTFLTTTIGRAVLGGFTSPEAVPHAMNALVRAYSISMSRPTPQFSVREVADTSCIVRVTDFWIFNDSHQIGIFEGVCRVCGVHADVTLWSEGLSSAEFRIAWRSRTIAP